MDIAELKRQIPIDFLLEHYGVHDISVARIGWQSIRCPFHDDDVASGTVNLIEDRFFCHACLIQGDLLDIVQQVELLSSVKEAKDWIEENLL